MNIENTLMKRSESKCELCGSTDGLTVHIIQPERNVGDQGALMVCSTCNEQLTDASKIDSNHWQCLQAAMWSEHQPVQVIAYRMLTILKNESWAAELLEQMFLDESLVEWANEGLPETPATDDRKPTVDSNGARLADGDSVTLIKDLDVKGGGFTAKRGTLVKGITLTDNPEHVEGRVNGIGIVLVAKFLKKA